MENLYITVRFVERDLWLKVPVSTEKKLVKHYIIDLATAISSSYSSAEETADLKDLIAAKYGLYSVSLRYWLESDRAISDYKVQFSSSMDTFVKDGDTLELQQKNNFVNTAQFSHYAEGVLLKKGERSIVWKSRFLTLTNFTLSYFKKKGDKAETGSIDLRQDFQCKIVQGPLSEMNNIEMHLVTTGKTYRFKSDSVSEIRHWIRIIGSIHSRLHDSHNFEDIEKLRLLNDDSDSSLSSDETDTFPLLPLVEHQNASTNGSLLKTFSHLRLREAVSRRIIGDSPSSNSELTSSSLNKHADIQGDKIGFMYKKGNLNPSLRYRLFVLRDKILYYYKLTEDGQTDDLSLINTMYKYAGLINLEGSRIFSDQKEGKKAHIFRIVAPSRAYLLSTDLKDEYEDWKDAFEYISGVIVEDMATADFKWDELDNVDPEKPYKTKFKLDFEKYGSPDFEGFLLKQGNDRLKKWRRRWFILLGRTLFYCKEKGSEPLGSIPLRISTLEVNEEDLAINLIVKNTDISLASLRVFRLKAYDIDSFRYWQKHIETFIGPLEG